MSILGIDIGGSGMKAAPINLRTGTLLAERHRVPTPEKSSPANVADVFMELVEHFSWQGPIGCGFPAVVREGVVATASNIDNAWIGLDAAGLFAEKSGMPVRVVNDADAAGLAEMRFGAGKGKKGLVVMVTVGTGIGSALFFDGKLIPNTEFGHFQLKGEIAERYAADSVRKSEDLSWKTWGKRLNLYLQELEKLLWPDLIIIGGGASKKFDKYKERIETLAPVVPAETRNHAGVVGAAMAAKDLK